MSIHNTIFEARLVQCEDRRERSLAAHEHLMHLPVGESLLKRIFNRVRAATAGASSTKSLPKAADTGSVQRPPAFSN